MGHFYGPLLGHFCMCVLGHFHRLLPDTKVCLNTLFAELHYKGLIDENYMLNAKSDIEAMTNVKKKSETEKDFLSDDDIKKIYDAFRSDHGRHRYYAAYVLLIETGMRQQELFAIRLKNH